MLVVSGDEYRPGHGHILLPGTSLALPVYTFRHGHRFKRGRPGTALNGQQGQNYTVWGRELSLAAGMCQVLLF